MKNFILVSTLISLAVAPLIAQEDATSIIKKMDEKMRGEKSSESYMTMTIVRPTWSRTIEFKSWTLGTEYSMVLITQPVKEKGQSFLKRERDMWNWNPTISRMIKLPPSMLSQGWMGSDFTNDDLLNQSSIVVDYTHELGSDAIINNYNCYFVTLIPKENAPVVWGKVLMWVSKDHYIQLKAEYYDEDGFLVKTETSEKIENLGGRMLPTHMELIPADEPGKKTIVTIESIEFDKNLEQSFFSQQNMKRLR